MERRLISGHSPFETVAGFSRAVVDGRHVHVAGTAPIPPDGDPPEGAYEQARLCLEIIGEALERGGLRRFADVVRTRIYVTDRRRLAPRSRAPTARSSARSGRPRRLS